MSLSNLELLICQDMFIFLENKVETTFTLTVNNVNLLFVLFCILNTK